MMIQNIKLGSYNETKFNWVVIVTLNIKLPVWPPFFGKENG